MVETLIKEEYARERHRNTLFSPYLEPFLAQLHNQGYRPESLIRYLQTLTRFGEFLAQKQIKTVNAIRKEDMDDFLEKEKKRLQPSSKYWKQIQSQTRCDIQKMLLFLASQGFWAPETPPPAINLVEEFLNTLSEMRGLSPKTIDGCRYWVGKFLEHIRDDGTGNQLRTLTLTQIDRFLVAAGKIYSRGSMVCIGGSLRRFLRFLYEKGILSKNLGTMVDLPRFSALDRLPCALPLEELRKVFTVIDINTPKGRRDLAILRLLMTYGVRPGEIVKLRLDDVDWRNETIAFRRAKQGRTLYFPLTREVGEALMDYLRDGRPIVDAREIFIRMNAPHIPFSRGSAISKLVRLYLIKAGISQDPRGAQLFRHSLAVHLLRKGHPLKTLSDMLGHQAPESTYSYTKLALEDLQEVCLSVKEVLP